MPRAGRPDPRRRGRARARRGGRRRRSTRRRSAPTATSGSSSGSSCGSQTRAVPTSLAVTTRLPSASNDAAVTESESPAIQARRTAERHPAGAPAGREVGLRQARERDDRRVGIELAVRLDRAVEAEIAVHLVGEDQQPVRVGEVEQRAARLGRSRRRRSGCSGSMMTSARVAGVTRLLR